MNAIKMHQTPLHVAVVNSQLPLVTLLLHYGADVYARNNQGRKPRNLSNKNSPIYQLLLICEGILSGSNHVSIS